MFITRSVLKGDVSEGYRIGAVFRPIYRTPPFDKGKLLFPSWKYGVKLSSILVVRFIEMRAFAVAGPGGGGRVFRYLSHSPF